MALVPLAITPKVSASVGCVFGTTIDWASPGTSGNWENPANWNLARVPTASDDVGIPLSILSDYTVTLSSVQTVNSICVNGGGHHATLLCTSTCTLTILAHTSAAIADVTCGEVDVSGNIVNKAPLVDACLSIKILAGGTFVNVNSLDFSTGGLVNSGIFVEKCGALVTGTLTGTVVNESPCPTSVSTGSFASNLGAFTSLAASAVSSVSPAPPTGLSFPDGLFSFTISGLRIGQTVIVTITLTSPLPAGPFSYWKLHGGTWVQLPTDQASLDSTRSIITLTLTDGATPDDSDGLANGVIVDPGGPAIGSVAPIPEYPIGLPLLAMFMLASYGLVRRIKIRKHKS